MKENIQTQRYFNGLAEEWEAKQTAEEKKIKYLLSKLEWKHCNTILDLGCGTGVLFPYLERISGGQKIIFAIDFAECMAHEAAQKKYPSIKVLCACARYLPFPGNSINLIIAFHVFPHIRGKKLAVKECWRVLKPNGEFAILHIHSSAEINAIHDGIGGTVKNHKLPPGKQMCQMLESVGFEIKQAVDRAGEYFLNGIKT
ncbi:MAG: class I SAM-dependent methyltransferase [bacterium]|nr:MAG: class I SAM-dependent methyltransferase [bacterium]